MKKLYLTPEFELFEVESLDVICASPVEQYATEVNTNPSSPDPGGDDDIPDDF